MSRSRLLLISGGFTAVAFAIAATAPSAPARVRSQDEKPFVSASSPVAAGEYLMTVASCHDCHTSGWVEKKGMVAKEDQLTGNPIGYYGAWGTGDSKNLGSGVN